MILRSNKKYDVLFNLNDNIRYVILMGGRGAGRSHIVSSLIVFFMRTLKFFRGAIMRFILGDVRNSNFQEVVDRIDEQDEREFFDIKDLEIRLCDNYVKGLGFRKSSGEQKSKMKSLANFNFVHIEEGDEVLEEDFMQLDDSLRTKKGRVTIVITLNTPNKDHWIVKRFFNLIPSGVDGYYKCELKDSVKHNTLFIFTTFRDNIKNLNKTTVENYLRYKETKPDYYWNMIEGFVSEGARGLIYKDWQPITDKEYDELDYPEFYGGDFGFTNDPTAFCGIKMHNENVYVKELLYETGLINSKISKRLEDLKVSRVAEQYWDSAEPKSIEDLKQMDWNARPTVKGQGSRKAGVDKLLGKKVFYTESSTNLIKEKQTYCWALDRNKEPTNEPSDGNDHLLDALRGAIFTR